MPGPPYERCHQPEVKAAVAAIERRQGKDMMSNDLVLGMIKIVEQFLRRKHLICYGGTAINNILPKRMQFYDSEVELPDYDFFSPDPVADAKELANIYARHGYENVRASSGVHGGTFKVHVNYVPVADLTYLDPRLYAAIRRHTVVVDGIHYPPPPYLRMLMHLELSRPDGDISRWDKVAGRLALLDAAYPMAEPGCTRRVRDQVARERHADDERYPALAGKLRTFLNDHHVVFAGAYAADEINHALRNTRLPEVVALVPFVVISDEAKQVATDVKRFLTSLRLKPGMLEHEEIGEIVPKHYSVGLDDHPIVIVVEAIECHAYNIVEIGRARFRIATMDTMLTLFLPFLYVPQTLIPREVLVCLCNDLSRLAQECGPRARGVLARFDRPCYGKQTTLADIRAKKDKNYKRLKGKQDAQSKKEWTYYFMNYEPRKGGPPKPAPNKKEPTTKRKITRRHSVSGGGSRTRRARRSRRSRR
jgi:hypothetical protein